MCVGRTAVKSSRYLLASWLAWHSRLPELGSSASQAPCSAECSQAGLAVDSPVKLLRISWLVLLIGQRLLVGAALGGEVSPRFQPVLKKPYLSLSLKF